MIYICLCVPVAKWEHTQWTAEQQFNNVTKQGLPMPTVELRIVDTEDFSKILPQDGVAQGELLTRGPHITGIISLN
jgi:long-subunit acyl-CoA synthetase (AMP-forming)